MLECFEAPTALLAGDTCQAPTQCPQVHPLVRRLDAEQVSFPWCARNTLMFRGNIGAPIVSATMRFLKNEIGVLVMVASSLIHLFNQQKQAR